MPSVLARFKHTTSFPNDPVFQRPGTWGDGRLVSDVLDRIDRELAATAPGGPDRLTTCSHRFLRIS
jgi:hypothetical protein